MSPEELKAAQEAARAQIKAVFDDGCAEINDRKYVFTKFTFDERRTVFAYSSKIQGLLVNNDLSFIDSPEYKALERNVIFKRITVDDMALSKKNVFEDYPEDYILFITTALQVISYPFLKGKTGA